MADGDTHDCRFDLREIAGNYNFSSNHNADPVCHSQLFSWTQHFSHRLASCDAGLSAIVKRLLRVSCLLARHQSTISYQELSLYGDVVHHQCSFQQLENHNTTAE